MFGEVEGQIKLLRNERVKLWVNQIRCATRDVEDAIDEFILNMDHPQRRLNILKFLPTCVGMVDKLPFIHELDSRVKDINAMIGAIMANRSKYGLEALTVMPRTRGSVDYPSTRGIQVDVGLSDATSVNRAESPLYGELYPNTKPA